ncbi:MAG TPA: LLM class flavin-dependent oxidoreductase, partial [Streptosporangiaceae bacterium]|nr:LLM class flavin-dependent oxidoreductase [Streptosporangiaceae bacterium]
MQIGLQIPDFTTPDGPARLGADLGTVARTADEAGFDFIAVMDHFFQIGAIGAAEREMLEAYTTLGYLAACTSRAKLLTLVTGTIYRHPGILAKTVTTLDVLSGGRAWLGIGAAWNEQESRGLGIPFPPVAERFERLEETLQICRQMWRGDESPYQGVQLYPLGDGGQVAEGGVGLEHRLLGCAICRDLPQVVDDSQAAHAGCL